jgi:outer membrane murein-binding lipoprotein Lpp
MKYASTKVRRKSVPRKGNMPVPPKWSGQDKRFGETIKNNLDVLCGYTGDPLDRAITARDLLDSGIVTLAAGSSFFSGSSSGLAPANIPIYAVPPAPTSLVASGAFQNILLTWDLELYEGHSYAEVFRHTSDSIADATLVGQVSGFNGIYSDSVGGGQTYYYWVRAVNQNSVAGPFNSSAGTEGVTATDVSVLLDLLTDQITSSQLATSLATPISLITPLNGKVSSLETFLGYTSTYSGDNILTRLGGTEGVANAASSGVTSLNSSVASLSTSVGNLAGTVQDLTANTGSVYFQANAPTGSIATNSRWYDSDDNNEPYYYNGTSWISIADPTIAANEAAISALNAEVFVAGSNTLKLATSNALNALDTTVVNLNGTVTSIAADVTSLEGEVFNSDGSARLATGASLTSLTNTVTTQGNNISSAQSDITDLEGEVFNSDGSARLATGAALTGLTNTVSTQAGTITSIQADVTALEGEVFNSDGSARLATGSALTGLTNSVTAIYDGTNASVVKSVQDDVTALEGEVFNSDGSARLATGSALAGLTNSVTAIYDGTNASVVKSVQTDVAALEGEVFNSDGSARLATGDALNGVSNSVTAIYDGTNASVVKSVQDDVTALNGAVFNSDGDVILATSAAVSALTNDVEVIYDGGNPSILKTVQNDITDLEGEVFSSDGSSRLATGSALTLLTNEVRVIYDNTTTPPTGLVKSLQADVTTLDSAMFNSDGSSKLASAGAVSLLETNVWGEGVTPSGSTSSRIDTLNAALTHPSTGLSATSDAVSVLNTSVYGDGVTPAAGASKIDALTTAVFDDQGGVKLADANAFSELQTEVLGSNNASASRIDGLYASLFDDGGALFADAGALETLTTTVTGDGGLASKVSNLAASMFTNGVDGQLNLATAEALERIETEVFAGGGSTSRVDQLSTAVWNGGNPNDGVALASADFASNINLAVFGDESDQSASANKIDTLQVVVQGADGNGGIKSAIETTQDIVSGENGLTSQYSVKVDNAGHVAGFGLSNTSNDDGSPTSAFIIRADKFAIVNPSASDQTTNSPSNNTNVLMPFAVQGEDQLDENGNVAVPAGVYMDGAFIKNGTITTAQIKEATIDTAKITGQLSANRIGPVGKIDTSLLNIDGSIIRSEVINGVSTLTLGNVSANKIKAGTLDCDEFTVENLRAKNITGDINDLVPFEMAGTTSIQTASGAEQTLFTGFIPEQADGVEKRPYISAEGWGVFENDDVYRIELWMKVNVDSTGVMQLGQAIDGRAVDTVTGLSFAEFNGDVTPFVQAGDTVSVGASLKGTLSGAYYVSSIDTTWVYYYQEAGTSPITAGQSVQGSGGNPNYQMVNSFFFRSAHDYHPYQFSISGGLGSRTSHSIDFQIRIGIYDAYKYYQPYHQPSKNWNMDKIYSLKGIAMSLR